MPEIARRTLLSWGLLLAGAAAGIGLGVEKSVHHKVATPPPPPPAALVAALSTERALAAGYDAVAAAAPAQASRLRALRADLDAHTAALSAVLETYPGWRLSQRGSATAGSSAASPSPTGNPTAPPPVGTTISALATAARSAAATLSQTCLQWPVSDSNGPTVVPLLGSISACLSTHAQELS
jgi:hypothetical protein